MHAPPPPPPRLEPTVPNPTTSAPLPPATTSTSTSTASSSSSSSSTCLGCLHFGSCSGCTHEFDLDRPPVLEEVANFFKGHGVGDFTFIRGQTAHHPSINAAVRLLRQGISELNIQPFDEDAGTGELRYVQFLWRNGGPRSNVHLIHSVWANFQTSTSNIIFGHKWRHLIGERDLWECFGGVDISLDPCSFGQANTLSFNSLLHKLNKYVPRGSTVVDLYSGAAGVDNELARLGKAR